jgi:hypothetical protein
MDEAHRACYLIDDQDDSFKVCRRVVNASHFLAECKRDYCTAIRKQKNVEQILCNAFAAMAAQCSEHFVTAEWRKHNRCRKLHQFCTRYYLN